MGYGAEVVPRSEITRSEAGKVAHRRGGTVNNWESSVERENNYEVQRAEYEERRQEGNYQQVEPKDKRIVAAREEITQTAIVCNTVDLAINSLSACSSPMEGSLHLESKPLARTNSIRKRKDLIPDGDAPNFYGTHSSKKS